jgi:multiple antibiotic resistance protein
MAPMTRLSAMVVLFLVLDPLGNIPVFLSVLSNVSPERFKRVVIRELLFALIVLVIFLFAGKYILDALGVSQPSLGIAGGIILALIAIKMIFTGTESIFHVESGSEPFFFPLAVPLTAGPSAMTTVILIMAREPSRWLEWFIALVCAWFLSAVILYYSGFLSRVIGKRGLLACERLMGMLLTAVAAQMFINGLSQAKLL